jgi:hypothetical protein
VTHSAVVPARRTCNTYITRSYKERNSAPCLVITRQEDTYLKKSVQHMGILKCRHHVDTCVSSAALISIKHSSFTALSAKYCT